MPNITTYIPDELYLKYKNLGEKKQKQIKEKIIELIKNELKVGDGK